MIFPGYDLDEARPIAEQVFTAINHIAVPVDSHQIQLSISVGLSELTADDQTPTDFYQRVDNNLYASKQHGRMRITAQ